MSEMQTILQALMNKHGDDAYSLQEKSGVPQPTTQRFLSGKHGDPRSATVKKWAAAYGIKESQLRGDEPLDDIDMPPDSFKVDITKISYPPVIGKAMGGLPDRIFTDEGRPTNGHDEYAEVFSADKCAFITPIDGNSMYPKYVKGDYALVEPGTEPEIEDDVLLKTTDGKVMLKRLISKRGGIHLASYNETETFTFQHEEILWMYYVAYPVPRRKIKSRV